MRYALSDCRSRTLADEIDHAQLFAPGVSFQQQFWRARTEKNARRERPG